jgi:hypothetical protein
MPRKFTITTPSEKVRLVAGDRSNMVFTLTNTSSSPQHVLLRAVPLGDTQAAWLSIGETEREFAGGGTAQVSVSIVVPRETLPGRYPFRLDIVSAQRGGEDYEEGPTVYVDVNIASITDGDGEGHWWMWASAAALLLIVGISAWLALRPDPKPEPELGIQKPKAETVALKTFWSNERQDNFTTATALGEASALDAGYSFARNEGYVFPTEQPGTVPLKLYWSDMRGDNYTAATVDDEAALRAAGYSFARIEGYIFPTEQPDTIPLKLFWSDAHGDNYTTSSSEGEARARSSGYGFVRIEGYVFKSGGAR